MQRSGLARDEQQNARAEVTSESAVDDSVVMFTRGERPWLHTALMIVGPLGLLVTITLSLWVSTRRVERSVVVQVEPQWISGERIAVRAELLDGGRKGVDGAAVELRVLQDRDGRRERFDMGRIDPVVGGGLAQGMIDLPELAPGPAQLELTFLDPERLATVERVDVEVVKSRGAREGEHTISTSMLQYADDTDPQPASMRIDLRPFGRILAGFPNRYLVRVTDPEGEPYRGPVEVYLIYGELDSDTGREENPPRIFEGNTDAGGLVEFGGVLSSEVVRFEVRVPREGPERPVERMFRLVSFPGGVQVTADPLVAQPGDTVVFRPRALRARRPVFLDVHGPDGAWAATLDPVVPDAKAEVPFVIPDRLGEGFIQLEAYHYTNAPGEGSAVARVYVGADDLDDPSSLAPLIERQRALLDVPRVEKTFDEKLERAHLEALEQIELRGASLRHARRWLIGSLPLEVHGPPLALTTRAREDEALATFKRRWTLALRWILLGGGIGFILITAWSLFAAYRDIARKTAEVLGEDEDSVAEASRAMLGRAGYVVGLLVITLVLTLLLLENLVFEF